MAKKNRRATYGSAGFVSKDAEFNPDYTHIKRDLGRIGLLAGSFIVVLIVISFFLK